MSHSRNGLVTTTVEVLRPQFEAPPSLRARLVRLAADTAAPEVSPAMATLRPQPPPVDVVAKPIVEATASQPVAEMAEGRRRQRSMSINRMIPIALLLMSSLVFAAMFGRGTPPIVGETGAPRGPSGLQGPTEMREPRPVPSLVPTGGIAIKIAPGSAPADSAKPAPGPKKPVQPAPGPKKPVQPQTCSNKFGVGCPKSSAKPAPADSAKPAPGPKKPVQPQTCRNVFGLKVPCPAAKLEMGAPVF